MATFTMLLKDVHDMEKGNIGLDTYPIFDEAYRASLNQKITDHYWNQEIGQESISMWRFAMRRKMNEIMPLYNQHYKLSLLDVDPLSTISIKNLIQTDGTVTASGETAETLAGTTGSTVNSTSGTVTDGTTGSTVNGTTGTITGGTTGSTVDATSGTITDGTTGGTVTDTTDSTTNGTSSSTSTSNAESRAVSSQTPQTQLIPGGDYADSIQDNISGSSAGGTATEEQITHGTNAKVSTGVNEQETNVTDHSTTTGTNEQTTDVTDHSITTGVNEQTTNVTDETIATGTNGQTVNGTEDQTTLQEQTVDNTTTGYTGHTAELIAAARAAIVNVDMMVIDELKDLFMLIWSNNDSHTGRRFPHYGFY